MTEQAITSMVRVEAFPFAPLATLAGINFHLSASDPEWQAISGRSRSSLDGTMQNLRSHAARLVDQLTAATPQQPPFTTQVDARVTIL